MSKTPRPEERRIGGGAASSVRATCTCPTAPLVVDRGYVICGACRSPVIASVDDGAEFSSLSLPPNISRRTFREVCRSGAVADARRDGAVWRCSRAAWKAARSRKPSRNPTKPVIADDVSEWLANADLRPTRRSA